LAKIFLSNTGGIKINVSIRLVTLTLAAKWNVVLKMADGSLLLVDAAEGPMPQTRFVMRHALMLAYRSWW
jgi:GTP-binding protein